MCERSYGKGIGMGSIEEKRGVRGENKRNVEVYMNGYVREEKGKGMSDEQVVNFINGCTRL